MTKPFALLNCLLLALSVASGQTNSKPANTLYTAGLANALIGGLYDGYLPYSELSKHGDFGLGAPDKLDGEILVLDGKIYQTQYTGKTFEVNKASLTPYAVVNYFRPDKTIKLQNTISKAELCNYLDSVLADVNGIYAIHIKGKLSQARTRAFPPVTSEPYLPMGMMLDRQHFFDFREQQGDLVGYRLPGYMDGANITGYHFHFITDKKDAGGHIIDFVASGITIEIDKLDTFIVNIPSTPAFKAYDFNKDRKEEVKSVESGKKD